MEAVLTAGAIEIDDARYDKSDISIHHNYTKDCQGFLEVTWTDVKQKPAYKNFKIHHNVSDDYQQFIALWWGRDCRIENNTIIRRKRNANEWGVFNITQGQMHKILFRNNIIVVENDVIIFNLGRKGNARPANIISNNLILMQRKENSNMGKEGPGETAVSVRPLFRNYRACFKGQKIFRLRVNQPGQLMRDGDAGYEPEYYTGAAYYKKWCFLT